MISLSERISSFDLHATVHSALLVLLRLPLTEQGLFGGLPLENRVLAGTVLSEYGFRRFP